MIDWFAHLSVLGRIYLYLAVPATLVLLIQIVMSFVGLGQDGLDADTDTDFDADADFDADTDFDADADADGDADGDSGDGDASGGWDSLRLFTLRGLVAFLCIFGWSGLFFLEIGLLPWLGLVCANALGAMSMLLVALVVRAMRRLSSSGTMDLTYAVGKNASVYLTIPGDGSETGKVMLVIQERLVELEAVTDCGRDIPTGALVLVRGLRDRNTLVVSPDRVPGGDIPA